MIPAKMLHFIC